MPWDTESAKEAAAKSAEARRRKADKSPEERSLEAIGARLGPLTQELLAAAFGEGDFSALAPSYRLNAIMRAMEWRLGRPATSKPSDPEPEKPQVPTGDSLFSNPSGS